MIETVPAWQIFFSPVIANWPIVVFFSVMATFVAALMVRRQIESEEQELLLDEIGQAKEEKINFAALDEEYPYWLPSFGPAKFMGVKPDPAYRPLDDDDNSEHRMYFYHLKSGAEIWVTTSPGALTKKS